MKLLITLLILLMSLMFAKHHEILHLPGNDEPGQGKTVVLISGDEEYRTEETMPMLAKILSQKHGFECKVLFRVDKMESILILTIKWEFVGGIISKVLIL